MDEEDLMNELEHDKGIWGLFSQTAPVTKTVEAYLDVPTQGTRKEKHERSGGRKKNDETQILERFNSHRTRKLKKEYLRVKIIRGHKKAIRRINKKRSSKKDEYNYDDDPQKNEIWRRMAVIFMKNPKVFKDICETEAGPMTDGKSKKTESTDQPKSFNNKFCKQYFTEELVRESYYHYVELVFFYDDPSYLNEEFNAGCCSNEIHCKECDVLWGALKELLQNEIIMDLDLNPYQPEEEIPQTEERELFY